MNETKTPIHRQTVKVDAYVEPHYPVKRKVLQTAAEAALTEAKVKGKAQVSISIIGDRKMRKLNKEYRGIDETTDVLAFPYALKTGEVEKFAVPETKYLNIGDIVISYPMLLQRAVDEEMMVDDMAMFLVIHGCLHLLGYDHEKVAEAAVMEPLEDKILKDLLPEPEIIK